MDTAYKYVGTQVTAKEKQRVMKAAEAEHITVSQYIRRRILGADSEAFEPSSDNGAQELLTVAEFAQYLRVSRTTAMKLISKGKVQYTKVHGMYRISRSSAEELIKQEMSQYGDKDSDDAGYMTLNEAARYMKYSPQTVANYVQTGKLKAYRANKQYRFKLEDIDAYLQGTCD